LKIQPSNSEIEYVTREFGFAFSLSAYKYLLKKNKTDLRNYERDPTAKDIYRFLSIVYESDYKCVSLSRLINVAGLKLRGVSSLAIFETFIFEFSNLANIPRRHKYEQLYLQGEKKDSIYVDEVQAVYPITQMTFLESPITLTFDLQCNKIDTYGFYFLRTWYGPIDKPGFVFFSSIRSIEMKIQLDFNGTIYIVLRTKNKIYEIHVEKSNGPMYFDFKLDISEDMIREEVKLDITFIPTIRQDTPIFLWMKRNVNYDISELVDHTGVYDMSKHPVDLSFKLQKKNFILCSW